VWNAWGSGGSGAKLPSGGGVGGRPGGHEVGVVQAGSYRSPDGCIETALRTRLSRCLFLLQINGGEGTPFGAGRERLHGLPLFVHGRIRPGVDRTHK
jgi:hypothetical protein